MHRSATSLVAKGLDSQINMGTEQLKRETTTDPYGLYENAWFIKLNNEILEAAGGTWSDPPSEESILKQAGKHDIDGLLRRESHGLPIWGWKDPRTTLTIRLYLPYLKNPHFVCCFRDPFDVAHSLQARNGGDISHWLSLASEYNARLLKFITEWTDASID